LSSSFGIWSKPARKTRYIFAELEWNVRYCPDDLKEGVKSCYLINLKARGEGDAFIIGKDDILMVKNISNRCGLR